MKKNTICLWYEKEGGRRQRKGKKRKLTESTGAKLKSEKG